jgi:AAA domain/DnaB-like helicase N terminal domain
MNAAISNRKQSADGILANLAIEKAVIGSLIAGGRALIDDLGVTKVDPTLFFYSQSQTILGAIADLYDHGAPIDLQIVTEHLRKEGRLEFVGGAAAITVLGIDGNPHPEVARFNLNELRGYDVKRRMARIADRMKCGDITPEDVKAELDEIIERSRPSSKSKLVEFMSPLQLKGFVPPPGSLLVGDYHVVKGSTFVIGGAPGVGKSRALVDLAVAAATGRDWFGLSLHRKFKVMIIQTENGPLRLSREFAELDCDTLDAYLRVCPPPPFGLCFGRSEFRSQLADAVSEFKPDLVGYDPWNAAAREQDSREYLDTFDALRSVLPVGDDAPAIGIVAHTRKPKSDDRATGRALLNLLAGSYVLGSVPRTIFVIQGATDDVEDNRVVWTCCKNNDGELGSRSAWERCNGRFVGVAEFDWDTFDNPHKDERVTITAGDLAEIFENGEKQLTRAEAVKALQALTQAKRTACYNALRLDGRFAKQLRESNGLLSWKA